MPSPLSAAMVSACVAPPVIEAGQRLVEDDQARVDGERAGDLQPLEIAERQAAHRLAFECRRGRRARGSRRRGPLPRGGANDGEHAQRVDGEAMAGRQRRHCRAPLIERNGRTIWWVTARPAHPLRGRKPRDIRAAEQDTAVVRHQHTGNDLEQAGLAGAVRTDEADEFALVHGERDVGRAPARRRTGSRPLRLSECRRSCCFAAFGRTTSRFRRDRRAQSA